MAKITFSTQSTVVTSSPEARQVAHALAAQNWPTPKRAASNSVASKAAEAAAAPKRRRLSPEVRADLILDCAANLILSEGLTEISMERVGRDANVSKALIYNYFPNLGDLLRALLERELGVFRAQGQAEITAAGNFEDLIRRTTRAYIAHIHLRGPLLQRLWKESTVARSLMDHDKKGHEDTLRYFVKRVRKEYGLPLDVAIATVDMQMAMTEAAAQHLPNTHNNVDLATDICVHLLLGGLDRLAAAYQKKP
jgi:TetR/AcrR family transcriptional regulator, fatty acid biosynthesis regulator